MGFVWILLVLVVMLVCVVVLYRVVECLVLRWKVWFGVIGVMFLVFVECYCLVFGFIVRGGVRADQDVIVVGYVDGFYGCDIGLG